MKIKEEENGDEKNVINAKTNGEEKKIEYI